MRTGHGYESDERGQLLAYVIAANGLAVVFALSPVGKRIAATVPLAALIGFQAFRLPLELILHAWYKQGSLPTQMTYEGDNWDIVTGIDKGRLCTARPVAVESTLVTLRPPVSDNGL